MTVLHVLHGESDLCTVRRNARYDRTTDHACRSRYLFIRTIQRERIDTVGNGFDKEKTIVGDCSGPVELQQRTRIRPDFDLLIRLDVINDDMERQGIAGYRRIPSAGIFTARRHDHTVLIIEHCAILRTGRSFGQLKNLDSHLSLSGRNVDRTAPLLRSFVVVDGEGKGLGRHLGDLNPRCGCHGLPSGGIGDYRHGTGIVSLSVESDIGIAEFDGVGLGVTAPCKKERYDN